MVNSGLLSSLGIKGKVECILVSCLMSPKAQRCILTGSIMGFVKNHFLYFLGQ
jgi:hypothetical protein